MFENPIAVLIHDVVTLEDLRSHFDVTENKRAEAFADHGANGGSHRRQFLGNLRALHFAKGNYALGKIHGDVADALEVVGDFQGGDNQSHFVISKRTAPEQADGVLINDNFHFVDARLEEKYFAGENRCTGVFQTDKSIESAVHGAFHRARHGNEIVHKCVIENDFRKSGSGGHESSFRAEEELTPPLVSTMVHRELLRSVHAIVKMVEKRDCHGVSVRSAIRLVPDRK